MIDFGREICGELAIASRREWLVTNGIGGYASGTVSGMLTRRYHGLLVAALKPPLGRTLLLAKTDDTVTYDGVSYPLFCNHWASGVVEPNGHHFLERFRLEGTTPVWTYACAGILLEKRVWMQPGANTTYMQYKYLRPSSPRPAEKPVHVHLKTLANYRDYHSNTHYDDSLQMQVDPLEQGVRVTAFRDSPNQSNGPFYLLSARAIMTPYFEWNLDFYLSAEARRGEPPVEDHLCLGDFRCSLQPGESFTLVASTEPAPNLDGEAAYAERQAYEEKLLAAAGLGSQKSHSTEKTGPTPVEQLVLAADQFIVKRASPAEPDGSTVIAGYPWFSDWGRDTMISLPGLTLATGRPEVCRRILRTYSAYISQGMLPNRFPDEGEVPEYNTVDATLWYFEAIRQYHAVTGDEALLGELFPALREIIEWHLRGTRYQIHCDRQDGLLYAGEEGVQLTWMDVKVEGWVVTPRIGKPVEINALWYNALSSMVGFARLLGEDPSDYKAGAQKCAAGFARFWNEQRGYCFDVIDGPGGNDPALRPNQLMAVCLPHSPLSPERRQAVVDVCERYLLTSHGLRSLAPFEQDYCGHYAGDRIKRDSAYHQGTVWCWLIGPFVSAHLRVYRDRRAAQSYLTPLIHHLADHGMGSISEIFDGDPPFTPNGCIAQAWSVGEVLRAFAEINGQALKQISLD